MVSREKDQNSHNLIPAKINSLRGIFLKVQLRNSERRARTSITPIRSPLLYHWADNVKFNKKESLCMPQGG